MCNVPTSQVHAWNGGSGGFLSGSTELKDPSSFNLVKACRSSHVGCHVVTRDDLGWPYHIMSHHVTSCRHEQRLQPSDFHSHHRISLDVTGRHFRQFQFLHWRRCRKRVHSHVMVRCTVRQSFSVAKFKLLFDTAIGAEGHEIPISCSI